ncbi:MAG TPA: MoaD/ThiS family protein [Vicinamibacterales bacterium]|nr:MoaD/ThiS family protein [Vicinamibacterales bacterium]
MLLVRLPPTLRVDGRDTLVIETPVSSIAELIDVLDQRLPGFRTQVDEAVFNFAVNDEILLHGARQRVLRDGDTVEIVPTIAGGEHRRAPDRSGRPPILPARR